MRGVSSDETNGWNGTVITCPSFTPPAGCVCDPHVSGDNGKIKRHQTEGCRFTWFSHLDTYNSNGKSHSIVINQERETYIYIDETHNEYPVRAILRWRCCLPLFVVCPLANLPACKSAGATTWTISVAIAIVIFYLFLTMGKPVKPARIVSRGIKVFWLRSWDARRDTNQLRTASKARR